MLNLCALDSLMGKSTGAGGLAIWTGNLKKTSWMQHFKSSKYSGPAVKAQAGVSVLQMYEEADQHGLAVVGGDCPVGISDRHHLSPSLMIS